MKSIIDKILHLASQQAEAVEVYYLSTQDTPIEFENNHLKSLQTKATQGVALRLIHQGKLGFASATDLTRLEDLVAAAMQTAEISEPVDFALASNFHSQSNSINFTPPTTQELVAIGKQLIEQMRAYNSDILASVSFHTRKTEITIATSQDVWAERSRQVLSCSLGGELVKGEDFLGIYTSDITIDRPLEHQRLVEEIIQKYTWAEKQASIDSGNYPVIFTPRATASIIGRMFSTILSGQTVMQKASPLVDKMGEVLFDKRFTIFEDPSLGPGACAFDDEGTPTTPKTLIQNGAVANFYWDRQWAARAKVASTGNGFRGGLSTPGPSLVNLCITPGETATNELIRKIDRGVIVDQVLGAGQSNQLAGEFSVNLDLGYKVENGEIVGRLKNTMVAGNIFEALNNLVDLGEKPEWIGGGSYLPSLLFSQLGVASRQG